MPAGFGGVAGEWTPPGYKPPVAAPTSMFGNPSSFTAAANTQASDYDKIMKMYEGIATAAQSPANNGQIASNRESQFTPIGANAVDAQQAQYAQSPDVTNSLAELSNLTATGGYNAQGIADLRARGIAPTRSIYANAQQNIERAKALGGGYSPNFNATQAQLARDESNQIGDITTNVNAGIAQNVASNRIAAASPYASAAGNANAAKTEVDRHNADIVNQINALNAQNATDVAKFNSSGRTAVEEANINRALDVSKFNATTKQAGQGTALGAVEGMRNLYGTTPALTNTFGNQVMQAGQLGQNQQQLNQQKNRDTLGFASNVLRG